MNAWSPARAQQHLLSLELFGMRFGLDRMRRLMTVLGSPQEAFRCVHVVGSNGKSSTVRMTAAILRRHGLRTGAYTSPDLGSFAQRILIDERELEPAAFATAVQRAARAAEMVNRTLETGDRVTQFELLTAAAYAELATRGAEVAVVEAGLGGRWDATNVIDSQVAVLTNVGLEHTRWLGPTIADIAAEKLAVVGDGSALVVGDLGPEAEPVARRVARERGARLLRAGEPWKGPLLAAGAFQRRNFALARAAAGALLGEAPRDAAVDAAARRVVVPGRCEVVAEDPLTVIDGAHNPAGIGALVESLPELVGDRPLTAVLAVLDDKDAAGMLAALLPCCASLVLTSSSNPRTLPPATLQSLAGQLGWRGAGAVEPDPGAALARARREAGPRGAVVATGSIHLIADLVGARAARAGAL